MNRIYPENLDRFLIYNKKSYIPRMITKSEALKKYKKYFWASNDQLLEIFDIQDIDGIIYYFLRGRDCTHCMTNPFLYDDLYELKINHNNFENTSIINHGSYYGYQIKYWFYKRGHSEKLKFFLPFVTQNSKYTIQDNRIYTIKGKLEKGVYKDCRMILERRELWNNN